MADNTTTTEAGPSPDQETPAWLKHLQNNSWEPEIFISGIMLAFIFAFPAKIYEFSARLIQEGGVEYLGAFMILMYVTGVISVFKIFFIVHLLLRFSWAGMLGVSYAFPLGVINERLFKNAQDYTYPKPVALVMKLERLCSMTFAFPTVLGLIILLMSAYFGALIFIYHYFELRFIYIYAIFMASTVAFVIVSLIKTKMRLREWYATSLVSSVAAIYQSNLGRWPMMAYMLVIFLLSIPSIKSDIQGFSAYMNVASQDDDQMAWPDKGHFFEDAAKDQHRFPRAFMPSEVVEGDFARISVAYYSEDEKMPKLINENFAVTLDTLQWSKVTSPTDLYRIYINDSLVQQPKWTNVRIAPTSQRAYQALIDISHLPNGIYTIRIEKLVAFTWFISTDPEVVWRKNWCTFSFVKMKD